MRLGAKGENVEKLQRRLKTLGYGAGPSDGVFGETTEAAVRAFQGSHGLAVDGIVSGDTGSAIVEAFRAAKAEKAAATPAQGDAPKAT